MDTSKNVQSTQVDTTKSLRSPVSSQGLDGSRRKEQMTTNDKQRTHSVKTKLIVSLVLLLVYVDLTVILGNSTQIAEWFARNFSRGWITVWGTLTGWIPFSLYELFLIVTIVLAVVAVIVVIVRLCQGKWRNALSLVLTVCIAVTSFLTVYNVTAGFTYQRASLPKQIYSVQKPDDFDRDSAIAMAQLVVNELNKAYEQTPHDENGNVVLPSVAQMQSDIAEEYKRIDGEQCNGYFNSYNPAVKQITNKWVMSQMHIVGVFFAPFGEANVNPNENNYNLPHSMAHEMAHGKGVMRENEANLVASYLLLTCDKPYLRYSALMKVYFSAISLVSMYPNSNDAVALLRSSVRSEIYAEMSNYNKFWSQFTLVGDIGNWFNDIYLKLHKQNGTGSYVKPPISEDTGEKDDDGNPIVTIVSFSDTQSLLVMLYKQGWLD